MESGKIDFVIEQWIYKTDSPEKKKSECKRKY